MRFTMSVVERLSSNGYLAAVPDVYHRCPIGTPAANAKTC
jgi:dienelactone hydrolase